MATLNEEIRRRAFSERKKLAEEKLAQRKQRLAEQVAYFNRELARREAEKEKRLKEHSEEAEASRKLRQAAYEKRTQASEEAKRKYYEELHNRTETDMLRLGATNWWARSLPSRRSGRKSDSKKYILGQGPA